MSYLVLTAAAFLVGGLFVYFAFIPNGKNNWSDGVSYLKKTFSKDVGKGTPS
jgi:hypothetical protein